MAITQRYGIKYPFTSDNDEGIFIDTNNSRTNYVKSQILHVIFTQKGQKLRDPEFGTNLIKYIFAPNDTSTFEGIKSEITSQINKYVNGVDFRDIYIYDGEDNEKIVSVEYGIKNGNSVEINTVAVKI